MAALELLTRTARARSVSTRAGELSDAASGGVVNTPSLLHRQHQRAWYFAGWPHEDEPVVQAGRVLKDADSACLCNGASLGSDLVSPRCEQRCHLGVELLEIRVVPAMVTGVDGQTVFV